MTTSIAGFTTTDLIAAASDTLIADGYTHISRRFPKWDTPTSRLFEDEYNIVAIVVFDTCGDLLRAWPDLQGELVEVISQYVGKVNPKSWDGYLVLLTPGLAPSEHVEIEDIRYNTNRLRKLVATSEDMRYPTEVARVLSPLLSWGEEQATPSQESALDLLPELLAARGIHRATTQTIVDAFREQLPLLERLHQESAER